jgi:hypothetical protein
VSGWISTRETKEQINMKRFLISTLSPLVVFAAVGINTFAQSPSREEILNDIKTKRAELQELENKFLAPSQEDQAAYADFLKQPDTGLLRLLPREIYESEAYKKNQKTLTVRGGGAYYSFALRTHEYGYGTDIGLENGDLSTIFAGANYGALVNLGDVPLQEVNSEDRNAQFISAAAVTREPEARVEQQRFMKGFTEDGVLFRYRLPAEVNTTYLLRAVNYSTSDVLVAFRLVRKDSDGSVIIAWKLLKKYPKPELARNN